MHKNKASWQPGVVPISVVMISLNEAHNMEAVCQNLQGFAQEVFLVDSYSQDETIDIALHYGVHVVQRRFRGFGDQWNFALRELPIHAPWVMKLDPDERLTGELKVNIQRAIQQNTVDALMLNRRLWFMGKSLPVRQKLIRVWKSGCCVFTDVLVNEHPMIQGQIQQVSGDLMHHDSPNLFHWLEKQNRYTSAEAMTSHNKGKMAASPKLLGSNFQRRMWLKKYYSYFPGCYQWIFLYHWIIQGAWKAGWIGYAWARCRADVLRLIVYKRREMQRIGLISDHVVVGAGNPDPRVLQFE